MGLEATAQASSSGDCLLEQLVSRLITLTFLGGLLSQSPLAPAGRSAGIGAKGLVEVGSVEAAKTLGSDISTSCGTTEPVTGHSHAGHLHAELLPKHELLPPHALHVLLLGQPEPELSRLRPQRLESGRQRPRVSYLLRKCPNCPRTPIRLL